MPMRVEDEVVRIIGGAMNLGDAKADAGCDMQTILLGGGFSAR